MEWRRPGLASHWLFYLVLVAIAVMAASRLRTRRWSALLPLLFLALIAARYVRNVGLFALLAPILVAALVGASERRRLAGIAPALAATVLLALTAWLATANYQFPSGFGVDTRRVPIGGVDFLARQRPSPNLFNVYGFGGYVAWRLWPEVATFIDGRNEVFAAVRAELAAAVSDSRRWRELLDRHAVNTALLSYSDQLERVTLMDPAGGPPTTVWWPYTETHFPRRDWALVYWDDTSLVYLRRSGPDQELIAAHEVYDVYPLSVDYQVEAIRSGRADARRCVAELAAKLASDPGCARARQLLEGVTAELGSAPD